MSANGGYGRFWGPNIDLNGNDTLGEGKIAGKEYIAYADDGSGTQNVSLLVQIPTSFNPDAVYRHGDVIGVARRLRCDLGGRRVGPQARLRGRVHRQGRRQRRRAARDGPRHVDRRHAREHQRRGNQGDLQGERGCIGAGVVHSAFPNRYAYKHAHSQQNPEKDWGKNTLQAIQFAY